MNQNDICDRELLGSDPRYGCRCQKCVEGKYEEAEYKSEDSNEKVKAG